MNMCQRHYKNILLLMALSFGAIGGLVAQVLPVGLPALEERYRREQLLGRLDSTLSFSIRPLSQAALKRSDIYDPDSSLAGSRSIVHRFGSDGLVQLM